MAYDSQKCSGGILNQSCLNFWSNSGIKQNNLSSQIQLTLPPIFIYPRIVDNALLSFHYIEYIWTVCTDQFCGV